MVIRSFEESCEQAGGKYTSEYGELESDVGMPHGFPSGEIKKEWCSVTGRTLEAYIFYAPSRRHLSVRIGKRGLDVTQNPSTTLEVDSDKGFDIEDRGEFGGKGLCFKPRGEYYPSVCIDSPMGGIKEPDLHVREIVV